MLRTYKPAKISARGQVGEEWW